MTVFKSRVRVEATVYEALNVSPNSIWDFFLSKYFCAKKIVISSLACDHLLALITNSSFKIFFDLKGYSGDEPKIPGTIDRMRRDQ